MVICIALARFPARSKFEMSLDFPVGVFKSAGISAVQQIFTITPSTAAFASVQLSS
jgi:hypothetical protein